MSIGKLPQNYDDLKEALDKLFRAWYEELKEIFKKKLEEKFGKELKEKIAKELEKKIGKEFKLVVDGAFPGYCDQQLKILFVGWEAYGCEGSCDPGSEVWHKCEYKDDPSFKCEERKFMNYFLANKPDHKDPKDSKHPERPKIAQLAAEITCKLLKLYGANKEQETPEYPECPKDMSLAFMDVSKFVNNKGSGPSPYFVEYVHESLGMGKYSSKNFIREEIELLNPDLIISWNLRAKLRVKRFNKLLTGNHKQNPENIKGLPEDVLRGRAWKYTFDDGRKIPLFDTYHFSARLDAERYISEPVMKAFSSEVVKKPIEEKKAQDKKEQ